MTKKRVFKNNNQVKAKAAQTPGTGDHTHSTQDAVILEPEPYRPGNKRIGWIIVMIGLLLFVLISLSIGITLYIQAFEEASGVPGRMIVQTIREGRQIDPFSATGKVTLALLGTDELDQRNGAPALTDTIMLLTIQKNGHIHLISIPRDLWIDEYKTKINALYTLAEQNEPGSGSVTIKKVLGTISGLPIDYLFIMNMGTVEQVVDALGGVDIEVERAFTDERYPRSGVDISSDDPNVLYETVTFAQGHQHFDGATALKYIRSRQSDDPEEGSDLARNRRQQQILKSIMQQVDPWQLIRQVSMVGNLYRIYKEEVNTDLPDPVLVSMGIELIGKPVEILPIALPVVTNDQFGLLRENPKNSFGLWVLEPIDQSWENITAYLAKEID